jgi:hypothetical protein
MNMLGHDHVPVDPKPILAARLLQTRKKQIANPGLAEERKTVIGAEGDEMRLSGFLVTLQAEGHDGTLTWVRGAHLCYLRQRWGTESFTIPFREEMWATSQLTVFPSAKPIVSNSSEMSQTVSRNPTESFELQEKPTPTVVWLR